ncbi:MAG TPA: tetratricopeptide repeat protein [Bryobacteraceae bacterium]|jgi:tetratricopeptide (TPR) repeat protein|nr:tetratricopeptide repeat protein [Bryobacteraceae bacterium]
MRLDLWIHCRTLLFSGLLSFFSALCLPLKATPVAPNDFDQMMKQARGAVTKFDLVSARSLVKQACQNEVSAWDPSVEVASARAAVCETEMGVIEEADRRTDAAEAHYKRALSIWAQLSPAYSIYHATTLMNLGTIYHTQRRMPEAETMLTQALALAQDPASGESDAKLIATVSSRLGSFYTDSGAPERGRRLLTDAIAALRSQTAGGSVEVAFASNSLGMLDLRAGDYKAAQVHLREAVLLAEAELGEDNPDTAVCQSNLGMALYLDGQYDRAELLLRRAHYVAESRLPGSVEEGRILATLTAVETTNGRLAQAQSDGERALAILSAKRDPQNLELAFAKGALATVYVREGKLAEAAKLQPDAAAPQAETVPPRPHAHSPHKALFWRRRSP